MLFNKKGVDRAIMKQKYVNDHPVRGLSLLELENNHNKVRHAHVIICIDMLRHFEVWFGAFSGNLTDTKN